MNTEGIDFLIFYLLKLFFCTFADFFNYKSVDFSKNQKMPKTKILIVLIIFIPQLILAQYKPKVFEFGPKVGLNLTGINNADTVTFSKKPSFNYQVGVFTRLNLGKFNIQPEFIYQRKGTTITKPFQAKYNYQYLSTPILIGVTPFKGLFLETGPEFSWSLNKGYKKAGATIYGPDAAVDKSWIVGARINLLDMFSLFSVNIRYTHGLTDQSNVAWLKTPLVFTNRTFQLSASYTFSEFYQWKRKHDGKRK